MLRGELSRKEPHDRKKRIMVWPCNYQETIYKIDMKSNHTSTSQKENVEVVGWFYEENFFFKAFESFCTFHSPGLGSVSNEERDNKTFEMVSAGLH